MLVNFFSNKHTYLNILEVSCNFSWQVLMTNVSTDEREIFSDENINSTPFDEGTIGNVLLVYVK